jgi:hypothetical protein
MKLLITLVVASVMASSCSSQNNKFDLQKMTFTEGVTEILKDKKKFTEDRDVVTTLPTFYTYETQHFKFGNVEFAGQKTVKDHPKSTIYFLLKDTIKPYQIKGVIIDTDIEKEGSALVKNLRKNYGTPKVLSRSSISKETKKRRGYDCFLWENIKVDYAILSIQSNDKIDDKEILLTKIVFIDSRIIEKDPDSKRTVLNRIIQSYKE